MDNNGTNTDYEQLFDLVSDFCKGNLSDFAHGLWIRDLKPTGFEDGVAYLSVHTPLKQEIIAKRFLPILREAYEEILGFPVDVDITIEDEETEQDPKVSDEYDYTFDTFIVGSSNKFAHAASLAVATNPSNAYNPLFIYGDSGLGKTHLLNAISSEIHSGFPSKRQMYVQGEAFTNELIKAIQERRTAQFHNKYRTLDVLLVDDIQFIGGKDSTQEEFFHTFNALYQDSKQIIMTSDRPPKEIKTLEDRLRTRFEWGLLADIQPPDFETRIAIIRRKAEQIGLSMPEEVSEHIANRLKTNIRQLEGVVKKMKAYKLLQGMEPSVLLAQQTIKDVLNDSQPLPVTIERILGEVGRTYGVSSDEIRSNKRAANVSLARQTAAFVIKEVTQIPHAAIGEEFSNRDHSTIVYALKKAEDRIKNDAGYKEMIEDMIRNIKNT